MAEAPASPSSAHDPHTRTLRRGDLVRVSVEGVRAEKRLKDREDALGRICGIDEEDILFTVEWIVAGGTTSKIPRKYLIHTTAQAEGMTGDVRQRKRRPPPPEPRLFTEKTEKPLAAKRNGKKAASRKASSSAAAAAAGNTAENDDSVSAAPPAKKKKTKAAAPVRNEKVARKKVPSAAPSTAAKKTSTSGNKRKVVEDSKSKETTTASAEETMEQLTGGAAANSGGGMSLYEKQRREFERIIARLEKVDKFGWFWDEAPAEFVENYDEKTTDVFGTAVPVPDHAPYNWEMIRRRRMAGRYVLNREIAEEEERFQSLGPYYEWRGKWPKRRFDPEVMAISPNKKIKKRRPNRRVRNPLGVDWTLFGEDVEDMIIEAVARHRKASNVELDASDRIGIMWAANKVREAVQQACQKTGRRQELDLRKNDDIFKFNSSIERAVNQEAAMQSNWRTQPFPERKYERLTQDCVCAGLSKLDERIASHELKTSLEDSFIGVSYRYDDTGDSEEWMKSVLDETEVKTCKGDKKDREAQKAALAAAGEEGVTRAQVTATMNALLMGVEDRYMTQQKVLLQPQLKSANWLQDHFAVGTETSSRSIAAVVEEEGADSSNDAMNSSFHGNVADSGSNISDSAVTDSTPAFSASPIRSSDAATSGDGQNPAAFSAIVDSAKPIEVPSYPLPPEAEPDIVEQPVWGIDCYTRRNVSICLETEFDSGTAIMFIEKWLLPAINACPPELAHDLSNATRLLEGLPFDHDRKEAAEQDEDEAGEDSSQKHEPSKVLEKWTHTMLGNALIKKIQTSAPPWVTPAAHTLRRAIKALGKDFFRVHPKGHGSVLLRERVQPNTLITFYRGEIYPLWRWGEKMDAIDITQHRKALKPKLPDFYNMTMERPQTDPRGYGTLIVDASRKAGYGSSLSHSCDPTCEVRVAALNGELCLAMTTLRELEIGEELTFNYNASTDSLQEYRSAICLCGYGNCRGSFLHFATADCYQQVLNRNSPIASRFANLVKGSTKKVMSVDDEKILKSHGFRTAAFGATAVNRRESRRTKYGLSLSDSLDIVPVWLRTYVADVLRYIEYERRALPIALTCNKTGQCEGKGDPRPDGEELVHSENGFSFFVKNQADILLDMVQKESGDLSEAELANETRRLGASLWRSLTSEKRQRWQDAARADLEKRKKEGDKPVSKKSKKDNDDRRKIDDDELARLISSEFEFQDADSEGIAAMGQRIQQLTGTLSRVGRVLDRHREGLISNSEIVNTHSPETLREAIHAPLSVIKDEEVVDWLWNREDGVVIPLLRNVEASPCVRPSLAEGIIEIRGRYSHLSRTDSSSPSSVLSNGCSSRQLLNEALLELRSLLIKELHEMSLGFRHRTKAAKAKDYKQDDASLDVGIRDANMVDPDQEALPEEPSLASKGVEESSTGEATETHSVAIGSRNKPHSDDGGPLDFLLDAVEQRVEAEDIERDTAITQSPGCWTDTEALSTGSTVVGSSAAVSSAGGLNAQDETKSEPKDLPGFTRMTRVDETGCSEPETEDEPWIAHYGDRFMLQVSADVLLMYAHTQHFFSLAPYASLESSPIEVYARELGNDVPISVIDTNVTYADGNDETSTKPRKQSALTSPVLAKEKPKQDGGSMNKPKRPARKKSEEKCSPEDIVAEVKVSYQGDYVLAQLLQWYNGGMGQKPGLPNLSGAVVLPCIGSCWESKLSEKRRSRVLTRTVYESKLRPQLVEWLQDPFRRGDPWPSDVDEAFAPRCSSAQTYDKGEQGPRFGSPVMDFLVCGDESGIFNILEELDSDNKITASAEDPSLLTSVDKGRPAQAVCRWVQCEDPKCLKWRKIPWHVDIDLLPEHFFCKDNQWDPSKNSCDALEDDWTENDKVVSDGKVEVSPIRKDKFTSPSQESSFRVGAKFDVMRNLRGAEKYSVATVTHIDFSGAIKRVKFHFNKTSSDADEWIPFGSRRIAPLYSKVAPPLPKRKLLESEQEDTNCAKALGGGKLWKLSDPGEKVDVKSANIGVGGKTKVSGPGEKEKVKSTKEAGEKAKKMPRPGSKSAKEACRGLKMPEAENPAKKEFLTAPKTGQQAAKKCGDVPIEGSVAGNTCSATIKETEKNGKIRIKKAKFSSPTDERSFSKGARFDVLRKGAKGGEKFVVAIVAEVDFSAEQKRIKFHYRKGKPEEDEWIPFGSPRIAELFTHCLPYQTKKRKSVDGAAGGKGGDAELETEPEAPTATKLQPEVSTATSGIQSNQPTNQPDTPQLKTEKTEGNELPEGAAFALSVLSRHLSESAEKKKLVASPAEASMPHLENAKIEKENNREASEPQSLPEGHYLAMAALSRHLADSKGRTSAVEKAERDESAESRNNGSPDFLSSIGNNGSVSPQRERRLGSFGCSGPTVETGRPESHDGHWTVSREEQAFSGNVAQSGFSGRHSADSCQHPVNQHYAVENLNNGPGPSMAPTMDASFDQFSPPAVISSLNRSAQQPNLRQEEMNTKSVARALERHEPLSRAETNVLGCLMMLASSSSFPQNTQKPEVAPSTSFRVSQPALPSLHQHSPAPSPYSLPSMASSPMASPEEFAFYQFAASQQQEQNRRLNAPVNTGRNSFSSMAQQSHQQYQRQISFAAPTVPGMDNPNANGSYGGAMTSREQLIRELTSTAARGNGGDGSGVARVISLTRAPNNTAEPNQRHRQQF